MSSIYISKDKLKQLQEVLDKLAIAREIPEDERLDAEEYLYEHVLDEMDMLVEYIDPYNYQWINILPKTINRYQMEREDAWT